MSDLLVSLIESIAGAASAAAERRRAAIEAISPPAQPPTPHAPAPPQPLTVHVSRPAPPQAAPPSRPQPPSLIARHRLDVGTMFSRRDSLLRTILAGEILGPPRALHGQNLWDGPRV